MDSESGLLYVVVTPREAYLPIPELMKRTLQVQLSKGFKRWDYPDGPTIITSISGVLTRGSQEGQS
jgi:hypothetical protein